MASFSLSSPTFSLIITKPSNAKNSKSLFQQLKESLTYMAKKLISCGSFDALEKTSFPAAASDQFELVFKVLDSNGDGKISGRELRRILRRFGWAAKEAEEMVREMDCNGDGFVDMEEFLKAMKSNEEDDVLMDAFVIFDKDKNGLISAEELQRIMMKLGSKKCGLRACKRMIEGVDRDGDGFVNFQDFRLMMTPFN